MRLRAVRGIHTVKIEGVLQTRHAGYEELLAVRAPERDAEILVFLLIEVGPDYRFLDPAFGLARNDRGGARNDKSGPMVGAELEKRRAPGAPPSDHQGI